MMVLASSERITWKASDLTESDVTEIREMVEHIVQGKNGKRNDNWVGLPWIEEALVNRGVVEVKLRFEGDNWNGAVNGALSNFNAIHNKMNDMGENWRFIHLAYGDYPNHKGPTYLLTRVVEE